MEALAMEVLTSAEEVVEEALELAKALEWEEVLMEGVAVKTDFLR